MLYALAMPLQISTCSLGKQRRENIWHRRINVVVKKPRSYWEGNTTYSELNVTFTSLIFTPFHFLGKETRMHRDFFTCQSFSFVAVWFGFCSEQSFLWADTVLPLSLTMNVRVPVAVSATSPILGLVFPHRSASLWSNMDPPKHAPHAVPLPGFLPRGLPNPCSKPFPEGYSHRL